MACGWFINCVLETLDRAVPVPPDGDGARGTLGLDTDRVDGAIAGEAADDIRRRDLAK